MFSIHDVVLQMRDTRKRASAARRATALAKLPVNDPHTTVVVKAKQKIKIKIIYLEINRRLT